MYKSVTQLNHREDNQVVQYIENEWVYPKIKGSHLFVFKDLPSAIDFITKYNWSGFIYECKVKGIAKQCIWFKECFYLEKYLECLSKLRSSKKKIKDLVKSYCDETPKGVLGVNSVKLTRRIGQFANHQHLLYY